MVAEFIIEDQNLPLVGEIISKGFPPVVTIKKSQALPSCRIYGNKDYVVFTSSYQFGPEISNEIVELIFFFLLKNINQIE